MILGIVCVFYDEDDLILVGKGCLNIWSWYWKVCGLYVVGVGVGGIGFNILEGYLKVMMFLIVNNVV